MYQLDASSSNLNCNWLCKNHYLMKILHYCIALSWFEILSVTECNLIHHSSAKCVKLSPCYEICSIYQIYEWVLLSNKYEISIQVTNTSGCSSTSETDGNITAIRQLIYENQWEPFKNYLKSTHYRSAQHNQLYRHIWRWFEFGI